jgi:hypothetical protein
MDALSAIFYVDNAYLAAQDPVFSQRAKDGLGSTFERLGLETNTPKTKAMTCTPHKIRLQLPADSCQWMRAGHTLAADWDACTVTCRECRKDMRAGTLGRHLVDLHKIYQGQVVAEEQPNWHEGVCVCVSGLRLWMGYTVMHEIPISSPPISMTSIPYPRTQ